LTATAADTGWAAPDAEQAVAQALQRRVDVRELDQRIAAARLDVSAVRAERLPRVALVANDGLNGKAYPHLLNTYDWSLRVSVPVFDGRKLGAREQEERAQAEGLEARRRELAEEVEFQVRDALLAVGSSRELVSASQARLTLAQAELDQARERFRAGVAGSADVFTASLRLSDARTAVVEAVAAYQSARVALAAAENAVEELK
jgi:outer membrane protein TolC